jgi:hypothetical protein
VSERRVPATSWQYVVDGAGDQTVDQDPVYAPRYTKDGRRPS